MTFRKPVVPVVRLLMTVRFEKLAALDHSVSRYFSLHSDPRLRAALGVVTYLGTGVVCVPLYALFLIIARDRLFQLVSTLVLAEVMGLFFIILLRYGTKRERPSRRYKVFPLTPWNRYSFPSHHALRSFIIAVVIGIDFPWLLPFLLSLASVISFSRIYLSKHYLSDVLVGALLGILLAGASQWFLCESASLQPLTAHSISHTALRVGLNAVNLKEIPLNPPLQRETLMTPPFAKGGRGDFDVPQTMDQFLN